MIRINLLPYHLRPIKRSPLPYIASIALWALALAIMISMYFAQWAEIANARQDLAYHQDQRAQLQPIIDEANQLEHQKTALADKKTAIEEIVRDRIIWSRQLWNLNSLAPENFWYDSIKVIDKPYRVRRPEIDPKTGQLRRDTETGAVIYKDQTLKRQVLEVSGYVIATSQASNSVNPLMFATQQDQEFSKLFELEPPTFKDTTFENFEVRSFTFEYVIKTGADEE